MKHAKTKATIDRLFLDHPRSVNETYLDHMDVAMSISGKLLVATMACFVHALIPGLFQNTASSIMTKILHQQHSRINRH